MSAKEQQQTYATPDLFDRAIGALTGRPDVTETKPSTIRTVTPLIGESQLFIVQTYRERERGDSIFVECVSASGSVRLVIPPQVADAIARQRDSLSTKVRSKVAKSVMADRIAAGYKPSFGGKRRNAKK